MEKHISFIKAVDGYFMAANARHLSPHTLSDYANTFRKITAFLEKDPPFSRITSHDIEDFLRSQKTVSNKTLLNYMIGLSALWHWASNEGLVPENIISKIQKPKPEKTAIAELSQADIKALLSSLDKCKPYGRPGKKETTHSLPVADRNRAIILLLLDTGIRATELCTLTIEDLDIRNFRMRVDGKGAKERMVPFSPRTGQVVWKYLATRKNNRATDPLFVTALGRPLDKDQLRKQLEHIAKRAGVSDVHPHRFRHTFAINYLRNGGDAFTLQMILGHSTMEMERHYLALAQSDLDNGHRRASPVDNWKL